MTPSDGEDLSDRDFKHNRVEFPSFSISSGYYIAIESDFSNDDLTEPVSGDTDNDGDTLAFEYRWYLNTVLQDGLDDLTLVPSLATRVNDVWEVEVRAYDGEDTSLGPFQFRFDSWRHLEQCTDGGEHLRLTHQSENT